MYLRLLLVAGLTVLSGCAPTGPNPTPPPPATYEAEGTLGSGGTQKTLVAIGQPMKLEAVDEVYCKSHTPNDVWIPFKVTTINTSPNARYVGADLVLAVNPGTASGVILLQDDTRQYCPALVPALGLTNTSVQNDRPFRRIELRVPDHKAIKPGQSIVTQGYFVLRGHTPDDVFVRLVGLPQLMPQSITNITSNGPEGREAGMVMGGETAGAVYIPLGGKNICAVFTATPMKCARNLP